MSRPYPHQLKSNVYEYDPTTEVAVGAKFKSNIHDAVVIVLSNKQGTVRYIVKDQGRSNLGNGTEYYVATSVFKDWYIDNGQPVK